MQHDEVIWQVINQNFCTYKVKMLKQNFCKNTENVTGLCNRSSCPLANSRYATIKEEKGKCSLWLKTIERAHTPKNMWEKVPLSKNYATALEQIDSQLAFWPKFLIHKNKQRLTKIHQYLIRTRKLALKVRPVMVGIHKKVERREARREQKAAKAARLTNAITNELVQRLKSGMYPDEVYNVPQKAYDVAIDQIGEPDQIESEEEESDEEAPEYVEDYEEEDEGDEQLQEIEEENEGDAEQEAELEAFIASQKDGRPGTKRGKRPRLEMEYEEEEDQVQEKELVSKR
jgi:protein MAK16